MKKLLFIFLFLLYFNILLANDSYNNKYVVVNYMAQRQWDRSLSDTNTSGIGIVEIDKNGIVLYNKKLF